MQEKPAFRSGSGSSWIGILLALLDPDPYIDKLLDLDPDQDPYIEYTDPQHWFKDVKITFTSNL